MPPYPASDISSSVCNHHLPLSHLIPNVGERKSGSVLLVDDSSEPCLALHDAVGDVVLAAKSRKPNYKLDGINLPSQLQLPWHEETQLTSWAMTTMVALLEVTRRSMWLIPHLTKQGILSSLALPPAALASATALRRCSLASLVSGLYLLSILKISAAARRVSQQQHELWQGGDKGNTRGSAGAGELTSVLIYSAGKLVDCRRDLETLVQHPALALETNVLRPLYEAGKVLLGLDIVANAEVLRSLLEEGVLLLLGRLLGRSRRSRTLGSLYKLISAPSNKLTTARSGSVLVQSYRT
eukprot:768452-Hanusia_phi.AAC.10